MGRPAIEAYTYTVDSHDVIVHIGGKWDSFARENGGLAYTREHLLNKRLWNFIRDAEIVALFHALFNRVRTHGICPACRKTVFAKITGARGSGT